MEIYYNPKAGNNSRSFRTNRMGLVKIRPGHNLLNEKNLKELKDNKAFQGFINSDLVKVVNGKPEVEQVNKSANEQVSEPEVEQVSESANEPSNESIDQDLEDQLDDEELLFFEE